jgi:putative membrane protein
MRLLIRWAITALSLVVVAWLLPGIHVEGNGWIAVIVMAAVLGLVNAFIRPILQALSCGLLILTLGLFTFVINAATFALASWISVNVFGANFIIDSFWSALIGSILVSVVSFLLSALLREERG